MDRHSLRESACSPAPRGVVFGVVGMAGYLVQTAVLWLLMGRAGLPVVAATLLATEAAVLHNFVWHVRWTWVDRPAGTGAMLRRLLRFNVANGGVSLAGGAAVMALLVDALGVHYLAANLVAVLVCSVANYLASDCWVFRVSRPRDGAGPRHSTYRSTAM